MLERAYELIHAQNPELTRHTRKKLKPPKVMRVGTTRTAWVNFVEICDMYVTWHAHTPCNRGAPTVAFHTRAAFVPHGWRAVLGATLVHTCGFLLVGSPCCLTLSRLQHARHRPHLVARSLALRMKRSPEHVLAFFLAELGTTGAVDGSDRLMLRGRYVPKYIESLLRKYISEYVTCQMCNQLETLLTRDPVTRLYFMNCNSCGSSRSVNAIKSGYHALGRGERRRARATRK